MRSVALVVLSAIGACAPNTSSTFVARPVPPPEEYEPARDPLIGPAWVQATGAYVAERCKRRKLTETPTDGDPPRIHRVDAGGAEVRQACGLVAHEVYTTEFTARFAREICGLESDTLDDACSKRFSEMFIARLSERYASANWAAVSRRCNAYPFECNSPVAIERHLLASHNAGIEAWYIGAVRYAQARQQAAYAQALVAQQRLAEERREERRRFWGNVSNALGAMGQAMAPAPSVNCTSNQVGTMTYTNCR